MNERGRGLKQNYRSSRYWYLKGTKSLSVRSAKKLAVSLVEHPDVQAQEIDDALPDLVLVTKNQTSQGLEFGLAQLYLKIGNLSEARLLLSRLSRQGHLESMNQLANLVFSGRGGGISDCYTARIWRQKRC